MLPALLLAGALATPANDAGATELSAGVFLKEFDIEKRYAYVSGAIEALAFSRFLRDRPSDEGMACILNWYYEGGSDLWFKIEEWFAHHPDKSVASLLYVMSKSECGE